jgi:predicted nucleic acid-binding protein
MILVDSSVWIDPLRNGEPLLAGVLAAVRLTLGASLWTRDKRLHAVAGRLALAAQIGD